MRPRLLKKWLICLVLSILCLTPLLSGCSLEFGTMTQLETPEITLYASSKSITWGSVKDARSYNVYCNEYKVATVPKSISSNSYVYDFSEVLDGDGLYVFYIVAVANPVFNLDSKPSNKVTYSYTTSQDQPVVPSVVINENKNENISLTLNNGNLTFTEITGECDSYELYIYSQNTGLSTYTIEKDWSGSGQSHVINLLSAKYNLPNEIVAIRMGYVKDEEHYVCSSIVYMNPDSQGKYTNSIYLFDGRINDLYLESLPELRNLVYYMFIYRIDSLTVKLSSSFKTFIDNTYSDSSFIKKFQRGVFDSYGYFVETKDAYLIGTETVDANNNLYRIKFNFSDSEYLNNERLPEPELSLTPEDLITYSNPYYEEIDWDGYYITSGHLVRKYDPRYSSSPYNAFVSDRQFLYTNVSSSEELYWAVENKVTPICEEGSRADIIYSKAKQVLNSIISDEMTDYEKALSIFDWICINTSYDYYSTTVGSYMNSPGTLIPVYYLEGVFLNGFAVCDGFSKAFSLMCNMEGIDTIRITGEAGSITNKGGHAWNKVVLDEDKTDNVAGVPYLVDITWTAFDGVNDREVSTHMYFMMSDADVITTHFQDSGRGKYYNYLAPRHYDYYNNTFFMFDVTRYTELAGVQTVSDNKYDLVITSSDELKALYYYMMTSSQKTMEVILDYEYIESVHTNYVRNYSYEAGKPDYRSKTYDNMINVFWETMRECKFREQYLVVQREQNWPVVAYNSDGDLGVVVVFENGVLIDENNEVGHLVNFLDHYDIYGIFELYITDEMLAAADTSNASDLNKAIKMFASALKNAGITIGFEIIQTAEASGEGEASFKITVSEKV